ncbi:Kynureninase (L-kynurenine hydrolase) [Dimargaris xerosporica]|nr:Kynureninase (L-kynurenine hydrolase) [Dimargaris xerosporica]
MTASVCTLEQYAAEANLDVLDPAFPLWLDDHDALHHLRDEFCIPTIAELKNDPGASQDPCTYLCGNSLGLQPKCTKQLIAEELDVWAKRGVVGHHNHTYNRPWLSIHQHAIDEMSRIVGAKPDETAVLNTLTVNIHFLLAAFYKPTSSRYKILMEAKPFPSDRYAIESHMRMKGYDPSEALIMCAPRKGEHCLRIEDILQTIKDQGDTIAIVFFSGVQYYTGQLFDMQRITQAGHARGCLVGFDLAHAVGNAPLHLHDWGVDFACWCSYKYLNAGPGGIAGIYVHERFAGRDGDQLTRLAGWWSNREETRFEMRDMMDPIPTAQGYPVSNPSVLAMVSLIASLGVFGRTDMAHLRAKSLLLTGYLEALLERKGLLEKGVVIMTPREPEARGCQLSLLFPTSIFATAFVELEKAGIICDKRKPNCIRVAPVPLYNTFSEVWKFVTIIEQILSQEGS